MTLSTLSERLIDAYSIGYDRNMALWKIDRDFQGWKNVPEYLMAELMAKAFPTDKVIKFGLLEKLAYGIGLYNAKREIQKKSIHHR